MFGWCWRKAGIVDACLEKRADLTRILKKKRLEQVKLELHGDLCQRYLSVAGEAD